MGISAEIETMWRKVIKGKEEFQQIIRLLVDFDEKTGRFGKGGAPEGHYIRRAAGMSNIGDVRFFIKHLGGYVYYVVAELDSNTTFCVTSWIHEDGIRFEREQFSQDKDHPVHDIICVSDLFERNAKETVGEEEMLVLNSATLDLMRSENAGVSL